MYNKASEQKNADELQRKIAQIIDIKLKEIDTKNQYAEVSDNDMLAGVSHIKDNSPDNSEVYTDHFSSVLDSRLDKIKRSYDEFDVLASNEVLQLKTLSLVSQKLGRNESADIQQMIDKETTDEKVKENIFEASLSATEKEADEIRKGLALGTYSLSAEDKEIIYGRLMQHAGFENAAQNDKALETSVLDSFDVYDKKGNLSPLYEGCVELASKIQYEFPEGTSADEQARLTKMYNEQLLANAGQRAAQSILKEKDFLQRYGTTEEISAAYKQRIAQQFERSAVLAGLASNEETGVLAKDIVVDKQTGKVSYKGDSQADIAGAIGKIMDGQEKINPFAVRMDSMDLEKETKEVSKQLNLKRVKEENLSFWKKSIKFVHAVGENLIKKGAWKKVAANALAFGGAAMLMASAAPAVVATGAAIYAGATASNAFAMPVYDTLSREMYEKGVKGLGNRLRYLKENWKRARTEKYAEEGFKKRAWIRTGGGIAVGAVTFGLGVGGLRGTFEGTVARQGTMAGGKIASLWGSIKMLSKAQREAKKARTVATVKALQTAKGNVKGDLVALSSITVSALTTDLIKFSGQMQNLPQEAQADMADIQKETAAINARVEASVEQPAPQHAAEMAHSAPQQTVEMSHAKAAATVEKTVVQQNAAEKISSLRGRMYGKLDDIVKPVKFEHELPKAASKADYLAQLRGTAEPVAEPKPIVTEYGIQMPEPEQEFVPEPVEASYEELYGKDGPVFEDNISENSPVTGQRMAGMPEDAVASEPASNEFYGDDDRRTSSFAAAREKAQSSFSSYSKAAFERQQAAAEKAGSSSGQEFGKTFQEAQERYNSLKESALKSMAAREPEIPPAIKTKAENVIGGLMKDWEKTNETVSAPNVGPNGEYPSYDGKKFSELTAEEKTALQSDWTKDAQKALMQMEAEKAAAEGTPLTPQQDEPIKIELPKEEIERLAKLNENVQVDIETQGREIPVEGAEVYDSKGNRMQLFRHEEPFRGGKPAQPEVFNESSSAEGIPLTPQQDEPIKIELPKEEIERMAKLNENAPVNGETKGTELPVENKAAEAPAAEKPVENAAEAAQLPEGASVSKNPWGIEQVTDGNGNVIGVNGKLSYARMTPEDRAAYDQMQKDWARMEEVIGHRIIGRDAHATEPFQAAQSREELYEMHLKNMEKAGKQYGFDLRRTEEGKYVLTNYKYCSRELGNDAVFEKAANVGKTPEEIAKNPFKVPDIGNRPETPKKGFIGRFKNNGGR